MGFLSKFGFWIGMAVAYVVAVSLHFVLVKPLADKNNKQKRSLNTHMEELTKTANQGEKLPNQSFVDAALKKAALIDKQRELCDAFLASQSTWTAKMLPRAGSEDPIPLTEGVEWRMRYADMGDEITKAVTEKLRAPTGAVRFEQWGLVVPTPEQILPEQKRFWLKKEIVDILLSPSVKIVKLAILRVKVPDGGAQGPDIVEGISTGWPFELRVHMEFKELPSLLRELAQSADFTFVVSSVSVSRGGGKTAESSDDALVTVEVKGYVIEFLLKAKKQADKAAAEPASATKSEPREEGAAEERPDEETPAAGEETPAEEEGGEEEEREA